MEQDKATHSKRWEGPRDAKAMREAVEYLCEYWVGYTEQAGYESYSLETFIDDALYGLGVAIDPDKYKWAAGARKFKRELKKRLCATDRG